MPAKIYIHYITQVININIDAVEQRNSAATVELQIQKFQSLAAAIQL